MSLDTTPIGRAAAELMERVADEYGPEARLEAALVLVDVSYVDEEGDDCTTVQWRFVGPEAGRTLSQAHAIGMARLLRDGLDAY